MVQFPSLGVALTLLCLPLTAQSVSLRQRSSFKFDRLRPDVTAKLLAHVEEDWEDQATAYDECTQINKEGNATEDCGMATRVFTHSCSKTVQAIVAGSDGNKDIAQQYLGDVCSEGSLTGWLAERCLNFTSVLLSSMTDDAYSNREAMDVNRLCGGLWHRVLGHERAMRRSATLRSTGAPRLVAHEPKPKTNHTSALKDATPKAKEAPHLVVHEPQPKTNHTSALKDATPKAKEAPHLVAHEPQPKTNHTSALKDATPKAKEATHLVAHEPTPKPNQTFALRSSTSESMEVDANTSTLEGLLSQPIDALHSFFGRVWGADRS